MTDETKVTMKPEEAIIEIRTLQLKHNQDIKQLQDNFKSIQDKIATSNNEINTKMEAGFNIINDKLTSHITSTMTQLSTALNNIKAEMSELVTEHIQKRTGGSKTTTDENKITMTTLQKEMQELKQSLAEITHAQQQDDQTQQLDSNQNVTSFSTQPKQVRHDRHIYSPITTSEPSSIHTNLQELNNNRTQTILLPPPTTPPVFHGKPTERPRQFLIRVEEYTENVHMWGEDMLLRSISQFLKDDALEWYCQLRSYHYLPRTWAAFKETFISQFNSPIRIAQQQQQWIKCKQNNEETINEFVIRLRALWVEQFPQETESDLIKHLLCKMHPDILNIIGCPRNSSLQQILLEAQRAEEILYYRARQNNQSNSSTNDIMYNDNYRNRNNYENNKANAYNQTFNNTANSMSYQRTQRNQRNEPNFSCYICGRSDHRPRDCWYRKERNNGYSQQSTAFSKNE